MWIRLKFILIFDIISFDYWIKIFEIIRIYVGFFLILNMNFIYFLIIFNLFVLRFLYNDGYMYINELKNKYIWLKVIFIDCLNFFINFM